MNNYVFNLQQSSAMMIIAAESLDQCRDLFHNRFASHQKIELMTKEFDDVIQKRTFEIQDATTNDSCVVYSVIRND